MWWKKRRSKNKNNNNSDRQNFSTTANQWTKCDKRERTENTTSNQIARLTKQNELNTHRIANVAHYSREQIEQNNPKTQTSFSWPHLDNLFKIFHFMYSFCSCVSIWRRYIRCIHQRPFFRNLLLRKRKNKTKKPKRITSSITILMR